MSDDIKYPLILSIVNEVGKKILDMSDSDFAELQDEHSRIIEEMGLKNCDHDIFEEADNMCKSRLITLIEEFIILSEEERRERDEKRSQSV